MPTEWNFRDLNLKTRSLLILLAIGTAVAASGCKGNQSPSVTSSAADAPVGLLATVSTAHAETGPVEETLETFGTVEFDPHATRTVSFVKSGQVAQVLVTPGQSIAEEDPLLRLGPLPASSVEVEQARINLDFARRDLERLRRLRSAHLATNEVVQQAEKEVAFARAALEGLGVDGSSGPRVITAPFSGVVVTVLVTSGAIVHSGEDALLVAPADGLAVRAGFEPEDAFQLEPGMVVGISPVFKAHGETLAHAVLARLHRVVDPHTQLVEALIRPERIPAWMVAGTKVRIEVVLCSAPEAVRIPREALVNHQGETGVFVVESGVARWRPIHMGIESDRWAEVRSGLDAGATVVTTGRTSLSDGMAVIEAEKPGA